MGMTIVFLVVLLCLGLLWIIKYPDIIIAKLVMTAQSPPKHVVAHSSGELKFLVKEGQMVKAEDVLAFVKNPASFEDILKLRTFLSSLKTFSNNVNEIDISQIIKIWTLSSDLRVGEVQSSYLEFKIALTIISFIKVHLSIFSKKRLYKLKS
jgi:hypothetical protein